ncbi:MAG: DNA-binding protein WhiA [Atopobiaceae bacterium]|nr:DNA-binding protein WhiA [Atopobiaceae bacterium]
MSFTAEVKDDLARIGAQCPQCERALLSALIKVCGTLHLHSSGGRSISMATETGVVARTVINLSRRLYNLDTQLTFRRSVLHKTRNYLIEMPQQAGLEEALVDLGILDERRMYVSGIVPTVVARPCCKAAYIRGVFMAAGFIADPRGDFHLEFAVSGEPFAQDLLDIIGSFSVLARLSRRRGLQVVYLKSATSIIGLLGAIGAHREVLAIENVRVVKSVKNETNRRVNAEMANSSRSSDSAGDQMYVISLAERYLDMSSLTSALQDFCEMRKRYPTHSLRELGQLYDPPVSKSALYHRYLRLKSLVEAARQGQEQAPHD